MAMTRVGARFVVLGVLALAACSPEENRRDKDRVDAEELAATAIENVERALRGTLAAGSFLADSQAVADSLGALDDSDPVTLADLHEARSDLEEGIGDLVEALRDDVFTEENLESEDRDSVTFLLGPDMLCDETDEDDADCVESALKLQPRLRLSSPGKGDVDVALLLTVNQHNPVTLAAHRDRIALVADLGAIKATFDSVGEDTGGLSTFDGKVSFEVRKNGELDYSASANVLEDLVVASDQDGSPVRVSLGASSPAYELRLDGNARTITGLVDYGEFRVSGPMNAFRDFFDDSEEFDELGNPLPAKNYTGELELVVAGLEGSARYDGVRDELSFGGFGLGNATSTLKWNGIPLAALDLNAALGRHFDVALSSPAGGGQVLTLSPTLDVSLALNFMPVADQIEDLADWLLNDTLRVFFDGANPSVQVDGEQLKVVSGTLNLTSSSAPSTNVSVAAGMCVVEVDPPDPAHELLGAIGAGVCEAP